MFFNPARDIIKDYREFNNFKIVLEIVRMQVPFTRLPELDNTISVAESASPALESRGCYSATSTWAPLISPALDSLAPIVPPIFMRETVG